MYICGAKKCVFFNLGDISKVSYQWEWLIYFSVFKCSFVLLKKTQRCQESSQSRFPPFNLGHGEHGGRVLRTVASQRDDSDFSASGWLGSFCVEFAWSVISSYCTQTCTNDFGFPSMDGLMDFGPSLTTGKDQTKDKLDHSHNILSSNYKLHCSEKTMGWNPWRLHWCSGS